MKTKAFLGIDVSKGYADFILIDEDQKVLEASFQLDDNKAGKDQLSELIDDWFDFGIEELFCAVESTGGYENNWYEFLRRLSFNKNVKVARLNPKGVKAMGEAALTRTITDAVSAESIAGYLISFPKKVLYSHPHEPGQHFKEGRQIMTFMRMLTKQKVQLNNQLEKLLYQYFSEILVYCRNGIPEWLLRLLVRYPSAKQVKRAGERMLPSIKGISSAKAKALKAKAATSDQELSEDIRHLISQTAKELLHKRQLIKKEENRIIEKYKDDAQVNLAKSIKGVGLASAVRILLEIEDVNRFSTVKKITAYFGVHPTFKQSGDGTWNIKMSKKGRSEIRGILYMCSLTAIRYDDNFRQLYDRFRDKGMNHYQAIGVCMHKMLRVIYGVLKSQTLYDPAIDRENVAKAEQKRKETKQKEFQLKQSKKRKSDRYKKAATDAPISRRAAQKRKKQEASQTSQMEVSTGSIPAEAKLQKL